MSRHDYYDKVKQLTIDAVADLADPHTDEIRYDGYTDGNAVSMYLNKVHGINVAADSEANRAFCDAIGEG